MPNHFLRIADLEKLPVGTVLPTLERGQPLLITTSGAGGGLTSAPMRINYVRIKVPYQVKRHPQRQDRGAQCVLAISTYINPVAAAYDSILGGSEVSGGDQTMEGACAAPGGHGRRRYGGEF